MLATRLGIATNLSQSDSPSRPKPLAPHVNTVPAAVSRPEWWRPHTTSATVSAAPLAPAADAPESAPGAPPPGAGARAANSSASRHTGRGSETELPRAPTPHWPNRLKPHA